MRFGGREKVPYNPKTPQGNRRTPTLSEVKSSPRVSLCSEPGLALDQQEIDVHHEVLHGRFKTICRLGNMNEGKESSFIRRMLGHVLAGADDVTEARSFMRKDRESYPRYTRYTIPGESVNGRSGRIRERQSLLPRGGAPFFSATGLPGGETGFEYERARSISSFHDLLSLLPTGQLPAREPER
jgi:hypothetical protein